MTEQLPHYDQFEKDSSSLAFTISLPEELEQLTGSLDQVSTTISSWIAEVNKIEEANGRKQTMKPRDPEKIKKFFIEGKGVVVIAETENNSCIPVGFCALTYELNEGPVYEMGSLIKSPSTKFRGIGHIAILTVLELPKAKDAKSIIAYANNKSFPLLMNLGGRVIPSNELATLYPYLKPYAGDVIVDLNPIRINLLTKEINL